VDCCNRLRAAGLVNKLGYREGQLELVEGEKAELVVGGESVNRWLEDRAEG
jgi:hypothetical protein